jgi:spermidine synthase
MKKATVLEQVTTPDGSVQALVERDGHYMIWVNGRELMSTRHAFSEEQLGVVGCQPLQSRKRACVLIGGLGLGFTLRAALGTVRSDAKVVVAELMPEVVTWNRNPAYPLARAALADPRVEVALGDVAALIARSTARFDAILLDADNETTAMNTAGNSALYQSAGLACITRALKPQGTVVYWSVGDDPALIKRLMSAGFTVESRRVPKYDAGQGGQRPGQNPSQTRPSGGHHVLIIGTLAAKPEAGR